MITLCLGMPGSASTLAFNLVREILGGMPDRVVTAVEATSLDALEMVLNGPPTEILVIRAHTASHALLALLDAGAVPILLTARDPRDCVASLCARLGGAPVNWVTDVARSLAAVATVQARRDIPALGFEAAEDVAGMAVRLAEALGLRLDRAAATRIASGWTREAVAGRLRRLRAEGVPGDWGWRSDPATGLNERHLGDGRGAKWHETVPQPDAARLDEAFGALGPVTEAARPGRILRFAEPFFGTAARPEGMGNLPEESGIGLRLLCLCYLGIGRWRVTVRGSLPARHLPGRLHLVVGGVVQVSLDLPVPPPGAETLSLPPDLSAAFDHRNHEHQMELTLEGPATGLPDPLRPDGLVLEAVLEAT